MAADGDGPRVCGAVTIVSATDEASSGDVDCNCWGNEEELCTSKQFKVDSSIPVESGALSLTHWGRVTHKCVGKLTIIGSDNGLSPGRHQAIIWTNAGILLSGPLGTNFSEI